MMNPLQNLTNKKKAKRLAKAWLSSIKKLTLGVIGIYVTKKGYNIVF